MVRLSRIPLAVAAGIGLVLMDGACALRPSPSAEPLACDSRTFAQRDCVESGYGLEPRRSATGSVSSHLLEARDLSGVGRIEELIDGRIPGVVVDRIGSDYVVHVRGATSTVNGGEPLVVVDGVPAPFGIPSHIILATINPANVKRIDVLKGASASVYGARGGNGVLIITLRSQTAY